MMLCVCVCVYVCVSVCLCQLSSDDSMWKVEIHIWAFCFSWSAFWLLLHAWFRCWPFKSSKHILDVNSCPEGWDCSFSRSCFYWTFHVGYGDCWHFEIWNVIEITGWNSLSSKPHYDYHNVMTGTDQIIRNKDCHWGFFKCLVSLSK